MTTMITIILMLFRSDVTDRDVDYANAQYVGDLQNHQRHTEVGLLLFDDNHDDHDIDEA